MFWYGETASEYHTPKIRAHASLISLSTSCWNSYHSSCESLSSEFQMDTYAAGVAGALGAGDGSGEGVGRSVSCESRSVARGNSINVCAARNVAHMVEGLR